MKRVNKRWRLGLLLIVLIICIVGFAALSPLLFARQATTANNKSVKSTSPAIVIIPQDRNLFEPFILPVQPGTTVIWQNNDSTAHPFTTTPNHNAFLNRQAFSFNVAPGGRARFTFTKSGLYHYYETRLDSWNSAFARIAANRPKINFPLSMEGVIWVQGPIADLPSNAVNFVLSGHDDFATEFLAVSREGTVTWHNLDADAHFVGLVNGWSLPINPEEIGLYRVAGTNDVPGGAFITVLFDKPGLYYYYCRNHDDVDPVDNRAIALPMASEFPIPMEGFVLVV